MNPNLQYAQAIKGITTGRGIGIIDTLHLVEPARAARLLQQAGVLKGDDARRREEMVRRLHDVDDHQQERPR